MQALLILRQRVAGHLVDELLQAALPLLDELLLEDALIGAEGQLATPALAWQRRHDDLRVALQLISKPLKVGVATADDRLFQLEDGQIALIRSENEEK